MSPRKPTKSMLFFGQSTAKDAPAFLLAKALGVWGKPPPALPSRSSLSPSSPLPAARSKAPATVRQGDLFAALC